MHIIKDVNKTGKVAIATDSLDDSEGFYRSTIGEIIGEKYKVTSLVGKGVFASVIKALNIEESSRVEVAIKILRNNDVMYQAGLKELSIIKKLNDLDAEGRSFIIKCLGSFEFKNHLSIVFKAMK